MSEEKKPIDANLYLANYLLRVNNSYIRRITQLREIFSDIYFDNLDKNNGLSDLAKESMDLARKEIISAKSELSRKDSKDKTPVTYN